MEWLFLALASFVAGYGFRYGWKASDTTDEAVADVADAVAEAFANRAERWKDPFCKRPWEKIRK